MIEVLIQHVFKLNCEFSPGVCLDTDAASIWHHLIQISFNSKESGVRDPETMVIHPLFFSQLMDP